MQAESLIFNKGRGPALSGVEGFTLLEVVVVGAVFTVGILGVLGLISQSISFSSFTSERLIASYLAQEGVEIVQNIRDTNFIEGASSWDDGLTGCATGCEADYTSDTLVPIVGVGRFLFVNGDNFYDYDSSGTETRLKRRIEIQDDGLSKRVVVTVSWEGKNAGQVTLGSAIYQYVPSAPTYEYEVQEISPFE